MNDSWKAIPGFGEYEASKNGRIRRACPNAKSIGASFRKDGILQGRINRFGYRQHGLLKDGKTFTASEYKLVSETFLGPRPSGLVVNHKDGDKENNKLSNLEYTTQKENAEHASDMGLYEIGENHYNSKLTEAQVLRIIELQGDYTITELGKMFSVTKQNISFILKGKSWKHLIRNN